MIAYTKNEDKTINILGGSPDVKKLEKIFAGKKFSVCKDDEVTHCVNGTVMLTVDVDEEAEAKAKAAKEKIKSLAELEAEFEKGQSEYALSMNVARLNGDAELEEELKLEWADFVSAYTEQKKELEEGDAV